MNAAELAVELRAMADAPRFASVTDDLTSIAEEVEDEDADGWAAINLVEAVPTGLLALPRGRVRDMCLGFAAMASVFLPVAWTWLSLRSAIDAYRQDLSSRTPSQQPFLAQWTTGFDGRLPAWHRLTYVAFVSVVLVVLAISLLIGHQLALASTERREMQEQAELERDLHRVLVKTQRFLAPRRVSDPKSIEAAVKRSLGELRGAHESTRKGLDQLAELLRQANAGTAEIVVSTTELRGALASTDRVARALTAAATDATGIANTAMRELTASTDQVAATLATALTGAAGIAESAVRELAESIDSSTHSQKLLAGEVILIGEHERNVRTTLEDAVAAMAAAFESLSLEMTASQSSSQATAAELTRSRDAIERLLQLLLERNAASASPDESLASP